MDEREVLLEVRITRCLGLMRKPTIESVLRLYTTVTGKEPPPELAARVREMFELADAEAQGPKAARPAKGRHMPASRGEEINGHLLLPPA